MDLFKAIEGRRSVRKFKDRPVPDDLIMRVIDAGRWAPSACNRQLWEFVIVTQPDMKRRIADEACFGQSFLKQAPTLIVVFYDETKERLEQKGMRPHDSIQSAAAAIQNMHLAAFGLGLGSLWVCAIKHMEALNALLGVPGHLRPIAIVALGYPTGTPRVPARRPMESFVHRETFHGLRETYRDSTDPRDWSLKELTDFRERICWYGGTVTEENTLEIHTMSSQTYRRIVSVVGEYSESSEDFAALDVLPHAGGYLIGMLRESLDPDRTSVFELARGNRDCIEQNLAAFDLGSPRFLLNSEDSIRIDAEGVELATCLFRLERMPEPMALLRSVHGALKPGGHVILACELRGLSGFFIPRSEHRLHTGRNWSMGPSRPVARRRYLSWADQAGFRVVDRALIHEGGLVKSLARSLLKHRGPALVLVLRKD